MKLTFFLLFSLLIVCSLAGHRNTDRRRGGSCPRFRTLDGYCTTDRSSRCSGNQNWGSAGTPHFSYIRGHSSHVPLRTNLPSARHISNVVSNQNDPTPNRRGIREFFVFFGEFLDHNVVGTLISKDDHFDIKLPPHDPLTANFSTGYLRMTRAERTRVYGEGPGRPERATNSISSALDLTTVYGPSVQRLRLLRTFTGGRLKTSAGGFMPFNGPELENEPSHDPNFFLAGDIRANDHPVLTSLHVIFLREHNYWCDKLARRYPYLSDEVLFQRARKINIAQMQKIAFEEFFPAITGRELPTPYTGHKRCVDPAISDVFSTAAYRIGHTLVGNNVQRRGPGNTPLEPLDFTNMFFNPARQFLHHGMETFLRGAYNTTAQEVDTMVSSSLRNFLFSNVDFSHLQFDFVDLIAINIQRGRDNAIPAYNDLRELFGFPRARKFSDITSSLTLQNKLSTVYRSPDEIDPWIGLMAEDHAEGASMGPTVRKIWDTEFTRIRDADRHFYLRKRMFSPRMRRDFPELNEIRMKKKETMKELLLRHTHVTPDEVPDNLFIETYH